MTHHFWSIYLEIFIYISYFNEKRFLSYIEWKYFYKKNSKSLFVCSVFYGDPNNNKVRNRIKKIHNKLKKAQNKIKFIANFLFCCELSLYTFFIRTKKRLKRLQPRCSYLFADLCLKLFLFCSYLNLVFSLTLFLFLFLRERRSK